MTGWNMPPGCDVSDIPGNHPNDGKGEAECDAIYDVLAKHPIDEDTKDTLVEELHGLMHQFALQAVADYECPACYQREMDEVEAGLAALEKSDDDT